MQMKTSHHISPVLKVLSSLSQYLCKVFQLVEHAINALYPPILVQFLIQSNSVDPRANQLQVGLPKLASL